MRLARQAFGRARKRRPEFAGGESVQGAQAGVEFSIGDAVISVEKAEKILARAFAFLGIAFDARGDEVAVGVAAAVNARDNVIEAARAGGEETETVEAEATLTCMDEFA